MRHLLISLKKEPYSQILTGYKKYEYRRKFIADECVAFVYVSVPVKAICGYIRLGKPIIASPTEIATIAASEHSEWYDGTMQYLAGVKNGYAIPIVSHTEGPLLTLDKLRNQCGFTPPQLYIDLEKKEDLFRILCQHFTYGIQDLSGEPNQSQMSLFEQETV